MKDVIVFDLDGTLRNGDHRKHLVPKTDLHRTESWAQFNQACGGDAPVNDNLELMTALAQHGFFEIIILTSCCDTAYDVTYDWLANEGTSYDRLIMRAPDDHRIDTEYKEAMLREIGIDRILCCYDDNPRVVRHIRSLGITCHEVTHYDKPGAHEK